MQLVNSNNKWWWTVILICLFTWVIGNVGCDKNSSSGNDMVLARVEVPGYLEDLNLPVYADLEDGDEVYYALVIATRSQLAQAGVSYRIIDKYSDGTTYLIAKEVEEGARVEAAKTIQVLYDDGDHIITRYESRLSEDLPEMGFELKIMSKTTINFTSEETKARVSASSALAKNTIINTMMQNVTEENLKKDLNLLSGAEQVEVGTPKAKYTLITRDTLSGEPVQKATQYVFDRLDSMGLNPVFEYWKQEGYENRNVVGEITGQGTSGEIIILIAHLDSINDDDKDKLAPAPGVDDDASGCAALLAAADIMRKHQFQRTIKFIFTTGEEQGTLGSIDSAERAKKLNQKIIAVINLDMVAYTKEDNPRMQVKTRNQKNRGGYTIDKVIADTCIEVAKTYGLDSAMTSVFAADGEVNSDHAPFWDKKYAAIWIIEYAEKGYLNKYMHGKDDTVDKLNMSFFAAIVKAALGTAAHLAEVIK
jgi:hypothetical protein